MPLRVTRRADTGALTIAGTVAGRRVRRRAQSDEPALAREEAATLEARLLRDAWHGERRGARSFAEAALSYLAAVPRSAGDKARLNRILRAVGTASLAEIDQAMVDRVRDKLLGRSPAPATVRRGVVTPIRAVLRHAMRRGWCAAPVFEVPREPQGRTRFLLPDEAERLIAAAAPHLRPLLLLLLGTGARLSEALELEWRDVDLVGGRATFWRTKNGRRRVAALSPRLVAALAAIGHREGKVFRWETKRRRDGTVRRSREYADRGRQGGGQVSRGWKGALKRAGLDPALTPHDLRHSWASWHYARHRDLLRLRQDGGWSSVALVERYAHLLPEGQEAAIARFWHEAVTIAAARGATA